MTSTSKTKELLSRLTVKGFRVPLGVVGVGYKLQMNIYIYICMYMYIYRCGCGCGCVAMSKSHSYFIDTLQNEMVNAFILLSRASASAGS